GERCCRIGGGAGYAGDVRAGLLPATDLVDRRRRVLGRRIGHRLDADGGVSSHGDGSDHDLPRPASLDIAPRTNGRNQYPLRGAYRAADAVIQRQSPLLSCCVNGVNGKPGGVPMGELTRLPALHRAPNGHAEQRSIPRAHTRYYAFLSYSHKDKELAD